MKKDEALTKINESDSDDFQVFTKDEHTTFLTNYKETEVSKAIKGDILEVHNRYEKDIKDVLGTEKESDEKTYDFLKRQLKTLKGDIQSKDSKITDLEKVVGDKSGDEALKLVKSDYDALQKKHQKALDEFKVEKESQSKEINKVKLMNHADHALMGIKFLSNVPEDARTALIEIAKGDIVKDASFLDGKVVFLDANGDPQRDDDYKVITVETRLKEKLKSIIDEGRKQPGVDIKDPVIERDEDGKVKSVNIGTPPDTVKTMKDLIEHLQQVGLRRGTDEYFATLKKWSEKLNLT